MPSAPPRACGCGTLVSSGQRCPRCVKAYDRKRGTAAARGYDGEWRRFREDFLRRWPTCCVKGCGRPATDVDHITALRDGGGRFDVQNCRPMCHGHHTQRTSLDQVHGRVAQ